MKTFFIVHEEYIGLGDIRPLTMHDLYSIGDKCNLILKWKYFPLDLNSLTLDFVTFHG